MKGSTQENVILRTKLLIKCVKDVITDVRGSVRDGEEAFIQLMQLAWNSRSGWSESFILLSSSSSAESLSEMWLCFYRAVTLRGVDHITASAWTNSPSSDSSFLSAHVRRRVCVLSNTWRWHNRGLITCYTRFSLKGQSGVSAWSWKSLISS